MSERNKIKNETKITKKDIEFIIDIYLKKSKFITVYRIFVFILGLMMTFSVINEINIYSKITYIIIGLAFIYFSILGLKKIYTAARIKNSKIDIPRIIQIDENKIDVDYLYKALAYSFSHETKYNQYKTKEMI